MKILFICTAHNSLSQRLWLALSRRHEVSIEYAVSDEVLMDAVTLFRPHLVLCPFLITRVPRAIYENYLTLIVHPGPPGDIGPSALDWLLLGDDGSIGDASDLLKDLDRQSECLPGRSHWGVTVLQATAEMDAGPVWAWEQFSVDIDHPQLTKSTLYRSSVTTAALNATLMALSRIQDKTPIDADQAFPATLQADPRYSVLAVGDNLPFQGGPLHHRPLLKAAQRDFDPSRHTARHISRRIRCGDSQPGALTRIFGPRLYVYGGEVEDNVEQRPPTVTGHLPLPVLGVRHGAICVASSDGKGVWITHIRRPKTLAGSTLNPKVPAVPALIDLALLTSSDMVSVAWPLASPMEPSPSQTHQPFFIDWDESHKAAYITFNIYNGAFLISHSQSLLSTLNQLLTLPDLRAVVLMGGSAYFSNGIALNEIEASSDPSLTAWRSINALNDVIYALLHDFPARKILTVAALRTNAAAGGLALAAACDVVVAGSGIVLNPSYRTMGLSGSEFHTLTYKARCGAKTSEKLLRSMTPLDPLQAQACGLIDYVFPGSGPELDDYICTHIEFLLTEPRVITQGIWKRGIQDVSLAQVRAEELGQMAMDFWSPRAERFHSRRYNFVRKVKPKQTPYRFAVHRRGVDEEHTDEFDSVDYWKDRLKREAESDEKEKEKKGLFPCYYSPAEALLTPPETPMSGDEMMAPRSVFC